MPREQDFVAKTYQPLTPHSISFADRYAAIWLFLTKHEIARVAKSDLEQNIKCTQDDRAANS